MVVFFDPIVFILLIFLILIPVAVLYGLYKLAMFLIKANKFIDQQNRKQQEQTRPNQ
ncbi:MAG: hypothetical protein ACYC7D_07855 [Nitrososphaerales archaeon]